MAKLIKGKKGKRVIREVSQPAGSSRTASKRVAAHSKKGAADSGSFKLISREGVEAIVQHKRLRNYARATLITELKSVVKEVFKENPEFFIGDVVRTKSNETANQQNVEYIEDAELQDLVEEDFKKYDKVFRALA